MITNAFLVGVFITYVLMLHCFCYRDTSQSFNIWGRRVFKNPYFISDTYKYVPILPNFGKSRRCVTLSPLKFLGRWGLIQFRYAAPQYIPFMYTGSYVVRVSLYSQLSWVLDCSLPVIGFRGTTCLSKFFSLCCIEIKCFRSTNKKTVISISKFRFMLGCFFCHDPVQQNTLLNIC